MLTYHKLAINRYDCFKVIWQYYEAKFRSFSIQRVFPDP